MKVKTFVGQNLQRQTIGNTGWPEGVTKWLFELVREDERKVIVLLPDGTNVNHTLVKDSWCWWYRKYAPGNFELERLESEARDAKRGLWADPPPVPPWVWRGW